MFGRYKMIIHLIKDIFVLNQPRRHPDIKLKCAKMSRTTNTNKRKIT